MITDPRMATLPPDATASPVRVGRWRLATRELTKSSLFYSSHQGNPVLVRRHQRHGTPQQLSLDSASTVRGGSPRHPLRSASAVFRIGASPRPNCALRARPAGDWEIGYKCADLLQNFRLYTRCHRYHPDHCGGSDNDPVSPQSTPRFVDAKHPHSHSPSLHLENYRVYFLRPTSLNGRIRTFASVKVRRYKYNVLALHAIFC